MKLKRSMVLAAILLFGVANQSFGFSGVVVPIPIPVPMVPVAQPVPVAEPAVVVAVPFFFGGFWWWNNGGYWYRGYGEHGPWGHPYRGRVPAGVIRYHHDHFENRGGHGYDGHRGGRDDHRGGDHDHH